jgi:hypothetical protein
MGCKFYLRPQEASLKSSLKSAASALLVLLTGSIKLLSYWDILSPAFQLGGRLRTNSLLVFWVSSGKKSQRTHDWSTTGRRGMLCVRLAFSPEDTNIYVYRGPRVLIYHFIQEVATIKFNWISILIYFNSSRPQTNRAKKQNYVKMNEFAVLVDRHKIVFIFWNSRVFRVLSRQKWRQHIYY